MSLRRGRPYWKEGGARARAGNPVWEGRATLKPAPGNPYGKGEQEPAPRQAILEGGRSMSPRRKSRLGGESNP